jgi:hypothetical protein
MAIDPTAQLAASDRRLRLVVSNGRKLADVSGEANGEQHRVLTEAEGEKELVTMLTDLLGRVDPSSDLWVDLSVLLAEAEQRARSPDS